MLSRQRNLAKVIDVTSLYIARACPDDAVPVEEAAKLLVGKNQQMRHLRVVSRMPFVERMVFRLGEFAASCFNKAA